MPDAEETVTFSLDGREVTARRGEMLIAAAERAGTYIPRFCYHPRMSSVGVCRMCLVEVDTGRGPTLQPSCFIEAADAMVVVTDSAKVKKAQDGVLEFLLVNHPLDCPVCDKGGECPLQDQTLAYGPGESRFVEEKRHFEKPIAISDLVLLDRERCIQCSRCTRFAEEVAGEALIDFAGRGERVEVATFPDEPFSSYFSGNTVQICPVGALTATPYRFTARPWDLDQVESTCTTCALGCRVAVQSSANRLTRLLGIDSDPVNHGWLCDKGRFVFEAVNGDEVAAGPAGALGAVASDVVPATAAQAKSAGVVRGQFLGEARETGRFEHGRLVEPLVRKDGELVAASWGEALGAAADGLRRARDAGGPGAIGVLGGARLTNEAAYAWARLAKGVLGTDSVDAQLADGLDPALVLSLPRATLDEACAAPVVVLLTGDVREELPVLFLRLREAAVAGTTALVEISPTPTALTPYAAASVLARPGEALGAARALTGDAAAAQALGGHHAGAAADPATLARAAALVAGAGADGAGVVVVLGRPSLAEAAAVTEAAALALHHALPAARFVPALRRGNVAGALDMGLAPGLLPGRVTREAGRDWFAAAWGAVPAARGLDATGILASLAAGEAGGAGRVRALVLLGADPLSDFPDSDLARRALEAADCVVAVTGHPSASTGLATVVLPSAVAHERPGTTTNVEGRVSRLGQKILPPGLAWPDWMVAAELAESLGGSLGCGSIPELWAEIERLAPAYAGLTQAVLDSDPAHDGVLVPLDAAERARALAQGVAPIDPVALPGVESVERQGAPPRVGLAEAPAIDERAVVAAVVAGSAPAPLGPADLGAPAVPALPAPDAYALRLVATRTLYDTGNAVTGSPSLTPLVPELAARANPYDLDRLGVATGDAVRLRTSRAELVVPASADPGVPRGTVALAFNVPAHGEGPANAAGTLIDAGAVVTDVRMESV